MENEKTVTIPLSGRIDSNVSQAVENAITEQLKDCAGCAVVFDASSLEYISSAGLRVILRVKKAFPDLSVINCSTEVYDILDMTGFTEMMTVKKAYKVVSVEGCEEIGRGANGTIYRIDDDNVVKVYNNADALEDIQHEREMAKLAMVLGIPTAISYDVVKVGESYGSVFELLNARSFSKIIADEPDKFDWCVKEYVDMLKKIHSTLVPEGKLTDLKDVVLTWVDFLKPYLPENAYNKLYALVSAVPHDDHMIHGDYHTKNLELQNDEVLLIDMDTLSVGNPVFELAFIYNALVGYYEADHDYIKRFLGFDYDTGLRFWRKSLEAYLGTSNRRKITEVESKARIIGYTRMIRRSIRRGNMANDAGKAETELWKSNLLKLLETTDELTFDADELELEATDENLNEVQDFVSERLEKHGCSMKALMQTGVAVEEIFVNVAHYAYAPQTGKVKVRAVVEGDPAVAAITFTDSGVPYDPLAKEDPDVTLSAEERHIGGLGIFMTKKLMDELSYEHKDGKNVFTMKKRI